jgi:hypothetical protein
LLIAISVAANLTVINSQSHTGSADPFAFFSPTIQISAADRQRIERGETIVNIVPGKGYDVAMVVITQTTMTPERLVAWTIDMERLKSTPAVLRIKKLSPEPAAAEFATLELPADDLRDIRSCKPGSCAVKLSAAEIVRMRSEMQLAGKDWQARGNEVFRQIARERVTTYLAGGTTALAHDADGHGEQSRGAAFAGMIANSAFLKNLPAFAALLDRPRADGPGVVSFTYWSVEQLGAKPITGATQTIIKTSADAASPAVAIAGKQIFATHYSSGSLNSTYLVRRPAASGPQHYLVLVSRSSIDAAGGFFGGIARKIIESRMRRDAPGLMLTFRQRIEAGPPRG